MDFSWETFTAYPEHGKNGNETSLKDTTGDDANTNDLDSEAEVDSFNHTKRKVVEIDDGWLVTTKQRQQRPVGRPTYSAPPQERTMLPTIGRGRGPGNGNRFGSKPGATPNRGNSRTSTSWDTTGSTSRNEVTKGCAGRSTTVTKK